MRKRADGASEASKRGYSDKEYDAALSFAKFMYDLWRESLKNEIIKADKTINSYEEPTNVD